MGSQEFDLVRVESGRGQPVEKRPHPGRDGIAGLMAAVVGIAAEEVLESGSMLVKALAEVDLAHRELVLICEEDVPGEALHLAI